MLEVLFGWSKASKCKKVIKKARCRLKLIKNKRHSIVRHSREDVAELIKCGHQDTAFKRVEQLIKDENVNAIYELIDQFCEFILTRLSYIRRHKDCPKDINEAVSSLIFASARIGDLPELFAMRKLFGKRYGQKFATTAVELLPGNFVNLQLIESFSLKSVSDYAKYRVVYEIARDHCLQPGVLAIEYYPDWQQIQESEIKGYQVGEDGDTINGKIAGPEIHVSEVEEIKREIICVDSPTKKLPFKPTSSCFLQESNIAYTSAIISTVQKYLPYIQMEKLHDLSKLLTGLKDTRKLVPYDDGDIEEETHFSASPTNGSSHDQRLSKFREKTQLDYDHHPSELYKMKSESDKSSTRSSRKSNKSSKREKRARRRPASLENQCIMDIGCMIYYHTKPSRNRSKHQKKPFTESFPQAGYAHKRQKHYNSPEIERINACSLDNSCYFSVHDDKNDSLEESNKGMELVSVPQRVVYNVFTYPDCNRTEKMKHGRAEGYERSATMPRERQKNWREKMGRTNSCPPENLHHVHPKLPDYDDIAAKFTALKREHLQNRVTTVDS